MTPPAKAVAQEAPLPRRGERVVLDGLPGGPWMTVVERSEDNVLSLSAPRLGGRTVPLPLQREFTINWSIREVPHEVDAQLVSGPARGAEGLYEAHVSGAPRRLQRRGAVRVPVNLIVHAVLGTDEDASPVGAITENLSAGGALLRLPKPVEVRVPFPVRIHCGGEAGELELTASAVRCDDLRDDTSLPWRVAVAFVDLTASDEDRLVKFVFERQRELRRREAGLS